MSISDVTKDMLKSLGDLRKAATEETSKATVVYTDYEIKSGTFDYRQHFPETTKLAENSFAHYLELPIKSNSVAATSSRGHKNETIRDIISNEHQVFRFYQMRKKVAHNSRTQG